MKTSSDRLKSLTIGICSIFATMLVAGAGEMPKFNELTSSIVKETVPTNHYRVDVSQINDTILTNSGAMKSNSSATSTQSSAKQSRYRLHYSRENGSWTDVISQPEGTNVSTSFAAPASALRVSVNIPKFLKTIQSWPTNSITEDVWGGKACYKISASTKDASTAFWVDTESKCVLRVILDIRNSRFSESLLRYRLDKENGWLLTSVDMSFAADGSHIRLEYGDYDFSMP